MATLIYRETRPGNTMVTHVYDNGDVWQISRDDRGVFANRITRGHLMRWFPSAQWVSIFGYPDNWSHDTLCARYILGNSAPCDCR